MERIRISPRNLSMLTSLGLMAFCGSAQALAGLRETAVGLERQLMSGTAPSVSRAFSLPLLGSSVVLTGEATLESLENNRCRRTLELVHDQPFERRGLRITNLSRRSVQVGPCHNFADAMAVQAETSAKNIAEQIGLAPEGINTAPGARVLVAQAGPASNARLNETTPTGAAVALTVLEKAIIRDAPNRQGEKLSRADVGTRLKAQRIPGNADWFVLDGGLRFISASVVDVTETAAIAAAPARGDTSRIRLKVMERAVLRNAPSFKGKKVAQLAAGVERLARKVPGMADWFELTDSESRYPLYLHESVVAQKPSDKRL